MKFLTTNKNDGNFEFFQRICFDTISQNIFNEVGSDDFCGIYYEGRNREINCVEDFCVIHSFKIFSKYNYPILVFCNNRNNFLNNHPEINKFRVEIIDIPEADTHDKYSQFFIKEIFKLIPEKYENLLFFHPDGFLIKGGWEDFITDGKYDYIGSPWVHSPSIDIFKDGEWKDLGFPKINVGNGGFSFRKRSVCLKASKQFGNELLREFGRSDCRPPPEDLFYSHTLNGLGYKVASVKEASNFSVDPITPLKFQQKLSFGFHSAKLFDDFEFYRRLVIEQ